MDWHVPGLRRGWRGLVDRFFGPGQTRAEFITHVIWMPFALAVIAWASVPAVDPPAPPWAGVLVLVLFAIDGVGGVVTNSTGTANRWFHRPGTRRERLLFVSLHLVHLALLAGVVLDGDWNWFALNVALLASSTVTIECTPMSVRRPTAALLLVVVVLNQRAAPTPDSLEWVPLLLYLKLLVAHLVPEAPFRDRLHASVDTRAVGRTGRTRRTLSRRSAGRASR